MTLAAAGRWVLYGALILGGVPARALEMPRELGDLLGQARRTNAALSSRQADVFRIVTARKGLPACQDHPEKNLFGVERPVSSLKHEGALAKAVSKIRRIPPEKAAEGLEVLAAQGQVDEHLGQALLLTLRSRGFVPEAAAYCHVPARKDGTPQRKWIGVTSADGSTFVLDLSVAAESGKGLSLGAWREGSYVGTVQGAELDRYLGLEKGADAVGQALSGVLSGLMGARSGQPSLYTGDNTARYRPLIERYAKKYGVSPHLIHAIMRRENPWGDNARRSGAGAIGLMQLMPETARGLGVDPYDPEQNIAGGAKYLKQLQAKFPGELPLVIASYNAGENAVAELGRVPNYVETVEYVAHVCNNYYWLTGKKVDYERHLSDWGRARVRSIKAY